MNCEAVKEMLWAYLEQEITAEEAVKIEEHLKSCESCREELELQKEMMEALAGLSEEELPEGYHAELMQKLQAEAAPNVVPFPVKKKKRSIWKQMSMVAAAVFVVVAAGGMDGMLEMREHQNTVVQEMRTAEVPEVASFEVAADSIAAAEITETVVEPQKNNVLGKQKAAGADVILQYDAEIAADAALPEMAHIAEEMNVMIRSMEVFAGETAVLLVEDMEEARTAVQAAVAAADGYETEAEAEGDILAVIPAGNRDSFVEAMAALGELEWTQTADEDADFYSITVQLKTK